MKNIAFIPARLNSSRFFRKVLFEIEGKTMLQRVYEGSITDKLDQIFITTCDEEIADHARDIGASVIMTSNKHKRCLDRVAEAYQKLEVKSLEDNIICIQGDEPLIDKDFVNYFLDSHLENKYDFSVASVQIESVKEFQDPDIVKIIWNESKRMVYTSRQPIPHMEYFESKNAWKIFGMFGFKPKALMLFNSLEPSFLENIEQCDTNRICGSELLSQYVIPYETKNSYQAIDNKENLERVIRILKNK